MEKQTIEKVTFTKPSHISPILGLFSYIISKQCAQKKKFFWELLELHCRQLLAPIRYL